MKDAANKMTKFKLENNFDNFILSLFCEVHYWEKLRAEEFEIPHFVLGIYQQMEALRVLYERVMTVVRVFNELIEDLSETESNLFMDHLRRLEKKIYPGLAKLMWSSRAVIIERFVQVNMMSFKNCPLILNCHPNLTKKSPIIPGLYNRLALSKY